MQYCALKRHREMILQCCSAVFYKGTVLLEVLWFGVAQYLAVLYFTEAQFQAVLWFGEAQYVLQCYILQRHSVSYNHLIMQCYILQRHYGFCSAIFNRGTVGRK